tara:strand:+ start:54 stop:863 length:810 start_codon:yes stop_codon:yes gene_type:complete
MIKGTDIPRTMPSGTELEVSATVDVSGVLACKVYVPLIDESFDSAEEILVHDIDQLVEQRDAVRSRLSELEAKASAAGDSQATQQLAAIKSSGRLEDIDRELAAAQGSGDGGAARNGILALQSDLDAIDGRVEWPTILQEYQELLERARRLLHEDRDSQSSLAKLEQEGQRAIDARDSAMLETVMDSVRMICAKSLSQQPEYWNAMLAQISQNMHEFPDPAAAESVLAQGARAMQAGDHSTVQSCVRQLWSMMPADVAAEVKQRGSEVM